MPPEGLPGHQRARSRGGRIPAKLSALPHYEGLDFSHLQPHHDPVPSHRQARNHNVRPMPLERPVRHTQYRLQQLPPEGLSGRD